MTFPLKIVSVGECTIDSYPELNKRFVGGISLNFAVQCKRRGTAEVSLVTCIGSDHQDEILKVLKSENVDASHVKISSGSTACQNILLTADGDRIFPAGGYSPGVLKQYQLSKSDLHFILKHNVVASALFKQVEPLFYEVMNLSEFDGIRVADFLDLSDYNKDIGVVERLCDKLTIGFISGDQEMIERLRPLSRTNDCLIVVTLGAEGSIALVKGELIYQSAVHVSNVVDSTGCGDAYQAAFTVSYCTDGNIQKALQSGAEHAACVLQHYGAIG
jgi:fructoselysine 6-kinase